MQTNNSALYQKMEQTYYRFKTSKLSRKAFCQAEGLNLAQFTYWCQRFDKKLPIAEPVEVPGSTPKPAKVKALASKQAASEVGSPADPAPGFTQIALPNTELAATSTPATSIPSATTTPTATPVMVLELPGKGRLEFYTPVEAEFLCMILQKGC